MNNQMVKCFGIVFIVLNLAVIGACSTALDKQYRTNNEFKNDQVHIRKTLLECGARDPTQYKPLNDSQEEKNAWARVNICALKYGVYQKKPTDWCPGNVPAKMIPACNEPVPVKNVELRINSDYCKMRTNRIYCEKKAQDKRECAKFLENIYPECLP